MYVIFIILYSMFIFLPHYCNSIREYTLRIVLDRRVRGTIAAGIPVQVRQGAGRIVSLRGQESVSYF